MLMRDDATPIQPPKFNRSKSVGAARVTVLRAPLNEGKINCELRRAEEKRDSFDTGRSNSGCGLRIRIEREQFLRVGYAAQSVSSHRNEPVFNVSDIGKCC